MRLEERPQLLNRSQSDDFSVVHDSQPVAELLGTVRLWVASITVLPSPATFSLRKERTACALTGSRLRVGSSTNRTRGSLSRPRAIWMMVPVAFVEQTIRALVPDLERGDILIDGGNSRFHDDIRRAVFSQDFPRHPFIEKLA